GLEVRDPAAETAFRHAEGDPRRLAGAAAAELGVRPGEEGEEGPRAPRLVAVVEVVAAGVVEVDRLLDQAQPEDAGVEVDVLLRVASDGGDMVDAGDLHGGPNKAGCDLYSRQSAGAPHPRRVLSRRRFPRDGTRGIPRHRATRRSPRVGG